MDEEEVEMEAEKELKGNGRAKGYGSPSESDSEALYEMGEKGLPWEMSLLSLIASTSVWVMSEKEMLW